MSAAIQSRPELSPARVAEHVEMLEARVFQVKTRWPHFRLLLADACALANSLPPAATVASLERTLLYGGISLFAPIFHRQRFISVDCSPDGADGRGAYNAAMVDDARTIRIPFTRRGREIATGLDDSSADAVLVPNLVHHVADQDGLFSEMRRILRPNGLVYVFEPTLRELHQIPDDFLRYTPYGMRRVLETHGFEVDRWDVEGGPFQAIAYCWEQALQYFPEPERTERASWFWRTHFPQLLSWDEAHRENHVRKHTAFPVAFSIRGRRKPG